MSATANFRVLEPLAPTPFDPSDMPFTMADGSTFQSYASGAQCVPPSASRLRPLNRAATFAEGFSPPPLPNLRRRDSIFSNISDPLGRQSFSETADSQSRSEQQNMDLFTSDEPTSWKSFPLAYAILPAVAGVLFNNGSSVAMDILMLGTACIFLNWSIAAPWDWYYSVLRSEEAFVDGVGDSNPASEEEFESEIAEEDGEKSSAVPLEDNANANADGDHRKPQLAQREAAFRELSTQAMIALASCFLAPIAGAYLLHAIRAQLTQASGYFISNFNLTLFVMAAELRPCSHVMRRKQARIRYLQQVIRETAPSRTQNKNTETTQWKEVMRRLDEIEARIASDLASPRPVEISNSVHQSLQAQIDALCRAVRRYETRATSLSVQVDARFREVDNRLRETLSLAAVAAHHTQQAGIGVVTLQWISSLFKLWMGSIWAVFVFPIQLASLGYKEMKGWLFGRKIPRRAR